MAAALIHPTLYYKKRVGCIDPDWYMILLLTRDGILQYMLLQSRQLWAGVIIFNFVFPPYM